MLGLIAACRLSPVAVCRCLIVVASGLVAPHHVESSRTRDRTHVPCIGRWILYHWVAQMVKNLPTVWETWVQSLGQEGPLEKGMTIYSVFLPEETPWTEEPGRLQSMGSQRVGHDLATKPLTLPSGLPW